MTKVGLLQLVLRDAILEGLDMDDRSSASYSVRETIEQTQHDNQCQAGDSEIESSERYMHHQRVVHVDPERELLLARHPPQIHRLQPVENQPEIALYKHRSMSLHAMPSLI